MRIEKFVKFVELSLIAGGILGAVVCVGFVGWYGYFWDKVMPGVRVAGVDVGGKTWPKAYEILERVVRERGGGWRFEFQQRNWQKRWDELGISVDVAGSIDRAWQVGRSGFSGPGEALVALMSGEELAVDYLVREDLLGGWVATVAAELFVPVVEPELKLENGQVVLVEGSLGREVDIATWKQMIFASVTSLSTKPVVIPVKITGVKLSEGKKLAVVDRAGRWGDKKLVIEVGEEAVLGTAQRSWEWDKDEVWALWSLGEGGWDRSKLERKVGQLAEEVGSPAEEALFQFDESLDRVTEFRPSRKGVELVQEEAVRLIEEALADLEFGEATMAAVRLPVREVEPEIKTGEVNELGIRELLGRGKSNFSGSMASRVHNVAVAASRLNGLLVGPGETFSFNRAVGDISVATGYKQAYVIRGGRTVLGDGGGVCQVSTTLFRAILRAGLPIMERHAHSYRVSYYEHDSQPGFDATVFAPQVDLRFKNDTPAYVLIQSRVDKKAQTMEFDLYGTSDGRVVSLGDSKVWEVTEPPEDLYQDDPALPMGVIRQVDYKAWGAKAAFDWKVVRDGKVLQERTFYSNYRPWQAVYLRGTGP